MSIRMDDISHIDLNLLRALHALLEERNVTRAATRVGVSQPAMSGMLTRLRETFSDPLFVRAQRGIVPTQRATDMQLPLRAILSDVGSLLHPSAFDPKQSTQKFVIAATDYALRAVAMPFIVTLKEQAPRVRIALVPIDESRLHGQLERAEVDIALVTPDTAPLDLHARQLYDEHYVCVLREGHPVLKGRRRLSLKQFCALDHALVSYSDASFSGVTDEALSALGVQRQVTLSVKSFLIVPEILRSSDMVAVLPSRLVSNVAGLAIVPPPVAIAGFTKTAVWHERSHRDIARKWLRDLLIQTATQKSPPATNRQAVPARRT